MKLIFVISFVLTAVHANLIDNFFLSAFQQIRPTLKEIEIARVTVPGLELTNLSIIGLEQFYHTALNVQVIPLKIKNLTIQIDHVEAKSSYKMDSLTIPNFIQLSGAGHFQLELTGITLFTKATLASRNRVITIRNLEEISVYLDELKVKITGLAGGGPVCDFLNELFNLIGTRFFNIVATPLLNDNKSKLLPYINNLLSLIVL